MRSLLTSIALTILLSKCYSQENANSKSNALSLELGKSGLIYNLAYDHKLKNKNFGFRATVGSNFGTYLNAKLVGGGGYYLVGKKNHFLELGFDILYMSIEKVSDDQKGFIFIYPDYSTRTLYPSLNLGYRRYGKKTLFRTGFSPGIIKKEFIPGGYISYGLLI